MPNPFLEYGDWFDLLKVIEGLQGGVLAEEYPPLDEVGEVCSGLVTDMPGHGNGKYIVQFLWKF